MNFWDQIHFWAKYGASDNLQDTREGSQKLHELTKDILIMLEDYLERDGNQKKNPNIHQTIFHMINVQDDQLHLEEYSVKSSYRIR